jgi:hypothetical protein
MKRTIQSHAPFAVCNGKLLRSTKDLTTKNFRFSEVAGAPDTPGVYAWYYRIELTDKDIARCVESIDLADNQDARDGIMRDFLNNHLFRFYKEVPYFVSLSGKLKPRYEGMIDQRSDISESLIRRLATSPNNLYELKSTLRSAVPLFASPIYIGVATRLRERILQHVRLIDYYQHIRASAITDTQPTQTSNDEEDRDHKFAYEVSMMRGFRPSSLIVNTLELPVNDGIRYDLENILNRINYPLCGRN